jgi:hypothetical protein
MREYMFCEYTFCEYTLREYMLHKYMLCEYLFCKCTSLAKVNMETFTSSTHCLAITPEADNENHITCTRYSKILGVAMTVL